MAAHVFQNLGQSMDLKGLVRRPEAVACRKVATHHMSDWTSHDGSACSYAAPATNTGDLPYTAVISSRICLPKYAARRSSYELCTSEVDHSESGATPCGLA